VDVQAYVVQSQEFIVLDRLNPLGGRVEGLMRKPGYKSFISHLPVCTRHGLTMGELALFIKDRMNLPLRLTIIPVKEWTPRVMAHDTDMLWVPPSPNMPTMDCAYVYPGTCLVEGTSVSEGRGTTKPFEMIGAPWLDAQDLADEMNDKHLPGCLFRPVYFTPIGFKHANIPCQGVQIHVTDPYALRPVWMGVELIRTLQAQSGEHFSWRFLPEWDRYMVDLLHGDDGLRRGQPMDEIRDEMRQDVETYENAVQAYRFYPFADQ
jgi:uncharacterized protein YbbC (DUF1343 family)